MTVNCLISSNITSVQHTKILIIGGGPAGATTSLFLSKWGVEHTLVDAATFPRDKVCGDGLDLKVARVLQALDPAIVREVLPMHPHFRPMHGLKFFLQTVNQVLSIILLEKELRMPFHCFTQAKGFVLTSFW